MNKLKPIIDITEVHDPRKGARIIQAEPESKPLMGSSFIAAFDLDWTLIKPKSGKKFPKDYDDWTLLHGVKEKLTELHEKKYKIVIFTNQAGSSLDINLFAKKIRAISSLIDVPIQAFVATDYGYCRKPSIGMWWLLTRNNNKIVIDIKNSFYIGDAAGRPNDFSNSDLKFALNLGLKFYTDVRMNDVSFPFPVHPLELSLYFDKYLDQGKIEPVDKQEMIIFVGPPAAGKSTVAQRFEEHGYIVVSQDELKTKPKVIARIRKELSDGLSVVVDRKNEYIDDRAEFISIANEYEVPVKIIWFDISRELSEHLATYREIMTGKHIPAIVFNKYYSKDKGLQAPIMGEGAEVIKTYFKNDLSQVENSAIFMSYLT
jgi:bifunctional polynucleotide phosphatase/kinase